MGALAGDLEGQIKLLDSSNLMAYLFIPMFSRSFITFSAEKTLLLSKYLPGLEVISSKSNKAIQAYCAGYIEINIFVISEAMYASKASSS